MSNLSFAQFLNEHYSKGEYMVIQESTELNEGMLDEFFITVAGKITLKHILSNYYGDKSLATTDGNWLVKFKSHNITVVDTSDPTKIKVVVFNDRTGNMIKKIEEFDKDTDVIKEILSMKEYKLITRTCDFESEYYIQYIQPYALKKYFKSPDTKPITTKKIKFERLLNLIVTGQITKDENGNNALNALLELESERGNIHFKQVQVDGSSLTVLNGRNSPLATFAIPDGKAKTKTVKVSQDAGEGHKVYSRGHRIAPNIGDFLTTSVHYTMLSSFNVYEIVGFSGKSSIVVQELNTTSEDNGHTRTIKAVKPKEVVGKPFEVRVSRTGGVKIHGQDAILETKFENLVRTGSSYD